MRVTNPASSTPAHQRVRNGCVRWSEGTDLGCPVQEIAAVHHVLRRHLQHDLRVLAVDAALIGSQCVFRIAEELRSGTHQHIVVEQSEWPEHISLEIRVHRRVHLKRPRSMSTFFLYNTSWGIIGSPEGLKIAASAKPYCTRRRDTSLLSTFSKSAPAKCIASISI